MCLHLMKKALTGCIGGKCKNLSLFSYNKIICPPPLKIEKNTNAPLGLSFPSKSWNPLRYVSFVLVASEK